MKHTLPILLGVAAGTIARLVTLKSDYRKYPSYPHGYVTHLAWGAIAAFVGAVAIPALIEEEYTAVTFLVLAAQQFREIRSMERKSLEQIECTQMVKRGVDYIEGIAKVFEARNYIAIAVALLVSGVSEIAHPMVGLAAGAGGFLIISNMIRQKVIGDIAILKKAGLRWEGPSLYVGDVFIFNQGNRRIQETIIEHGLGLLLEPKDDNARDTLGSIGQRQAIVHDATTILGIRKDVATPEFTPMIRRDLRSGKVALYIMPMEPDINRLLEVVRRVPVLETSQGMALKSLAGRKAAD